MYGFNILIFIDNFLTVLYLVQLRAEPAQSPPSIDC
jgi:hypothetical protein